MRLLAITCAALLAAGCTVGVPSFVDDGPDAADETGEAGEAADEEPVVQRGPAGRGEGKLSNNGLALVSDLLVDLETASLSAAASELVASEAGAQHLEYLAMCALDEGNTIVVDGARYDGLYGLAPAWDTGTCDESCQRWVSACLLAHANAFGAHVTISLRGDHPGLVWDEDIVTDFSLQEAAFYGNLFDDSTDSWTPPLFACAGTALIEFEYGFPKLAADPWSYLDSRICSLGFPCGLVQTGACHAPLALPPTCDVGAPEAGYYGDCRGPRIVLAPFLSPMHPEIITAYLAPE